MHRSVVLHGQVSGRRRRARRRGEYVRSMNWREVQSGVEPNSQDTPQNDNFGCFLLAEGLQTSVFLIFEQRKGGGLSLQPIIFNHSPFGFVVHSRTLFPALSSNRVPHHINASPLLLSLFLSLRILGISPVSRTNNDIIFFVPLPRRPH